MIMIKALINCVTTKKGQKWERVKVELEGKEEIDMLYIGGFIWLVTLHFDLVTWLWYD